MDPISWTALPYCTALIVPALTPMRTANSEWLKPNCSFFPLMRAPILLSTLGGAGKRTVAGFHGISSSLSPPSLPTTN